MCDCLLSVQVKHVPGEDLTSKCKLRLRHTIEIMPRTEIDHDVAAGYNMNAASISNSIAQEALIRNVTADLNKSLAKCVNTHESAWFEPGGHCGTFLFVRFDPPPPFEARLFVWVELNELFF